MVLKLILKLHYQFFFMGWPHFPKLLSRIFILALFCCTAITKVKCLNFTYPTFDEDDEKNFFLENSEILLKTVFVTPDLSNAVKIMNQSGRFLCRKPMKLWRNGKDNRRVMASFNSTFVLNISPSSGNNIPVGEGFAFIITGNRFAMENSNGKWLGIVNASTNGLPQAEIVAVEFDTRKSFLEDIDDNHVGLDVNSVYSIKQVSLTDYGFNLSRDGNLKAIVQYDGINMSVFLSPTTGSGETMNKSTLVLTWPINLSGYLPQKVFVGFSGSTGSDSAEMNQILSWDFQSSDIDESKNLLWVSITVPFIVVLLIGVAVYSHRTRLCCKENPEDGYPLIEARIQGSSVVPKKFQLRELKRATGNFSPKNVLGKGGFGTIYKGFLGDRVVAVKRVSKDSHQGEEEFLAEVTTICSLSHKHLVRLIGWCFESSELLIVSEFMPNGSLDKYIFGNQRRNIEMEELTLSWKRRYCILFGVAQALDYLHSGCERRVLHRDIKSSNILLDSEFNAKLGDFGLARTIQNKENTHYTTREIAGTPGYMAPESFLTGRATVETDVYAFGVLVLEVVSGRKPGNQNDSDSFNNNMVSRLWGLRSKGMILNAVDSRLHAEFDEDEMKRVLVLGLACCHPNPNERPSMRTAVKVLSSDEEPPTVPLEIPAFVWPSMPLSFKGDGQTTTEASTDFSQITEIYGR